MPTLRTLTEEEREELDRLSHDGLLALELLGLAQLDSSETPPDVAVIALALDRLRSGQAEVPEMEEDDLAYALGSLWGAWTARTSGWEWAWLTLDDGFDGFVLAPEDQTYAIWPHHYLYGLLVQPEEENTAAILSEEISAGRLPPSEPGALMLLG